MRMLLLYILLVAFGCQQTTVNGQQTPFFESENLKTSKSEKSCEPRAMSNEPFLESENLKNSESEKSCELRAMSNESFLESENLKTSESEKSCEQRAMSNESFLESENLKTSESEKRLKSQGRKAQSSQLETQSTSQVFSFSDSQIQKVTRPKICLQN